MSTIAEQIVDVQRLIRTLTNLIDRVEYVLDRYVDGTTASGETPDVERVDNLLDLIGDLQRSLLGREEQLDALVNPPTDEDPGEDIPDDEPTEP